MSSAEIDGTNDPNGAPLPNRLDPAEARETLQRPLLIPLGDYDGSEGTVSPIANVGALFEEGRHMCHCVAGFATRAMAGTAAYYHATTTHGANATVELVFGHDKKPFVFQVRGPRNESPPPAVGRLVRAWADLEQIRVDDLVYGDLTDLPDTPEQVPI